MRASLETTQSLASHKSEAVSADGLASDDAEEDFDYVQPQS
jgi:hypothetical protein